MISGKNNKLFDSSRKNKEKVTNWNKNSLENYENNWTGIEIETKSVKLTPKLEIKKNWQFSVKSQKSLLVHFEKTSQ